MWSLTIPLCTINLFANLYILMPLFIYMQKSTICVSDFALNIQVESFDINSKGSATICYCYLEEVPHHEISSKCLHGP
jgi:hypothetical protein